MSPCCSGFFRLHPKSPNPASQCNSFHSSLLLWATFPRAAVTLSWEQAGKLEVRDGELLQHVNSWVKCVCLFHFYDLGYFPCLMKFLKSCSSCSPVIKPQNLSLESTVLQWNSFIAHIPSEKGNVCFIPIPNKYTRCNFSFSYSTCLSWPAATFSQLWTVRRTAAR